MSYVYIASLLVTLIGLYCVVAKDNVMKKIMGLSIMANGIHLLLVSLAYGPIVDPLPHALVLTSIVIGLSTTALALVISVTAFRRFGSLHVSVMRGLRG